MLISGDRNSQRRAGNICTKILQYVQDFSSPQNDELSMKVTKTIKKLQFIKWTWACSPSTMLVNIWLLSAFTDSVSRLTFVHFWKLNTANSIFKKKKYLESVFITFLFTMAIYLAPVTQGRKHFLEHLE